MLGFAPISTRPISSIPLSVSVEVPDLPPGVPDAEGDVRLRRVDDAFPSTAHPDELLVRILRGDTVDVSFSRIDEGDVRLRIVDTSPYRSSFPESATTRPSTPEVASSQPSRVDETVAALKKPSEAPVTATKVEDSTVRPSRPDEATRGRSQ